MTNTEIARGLMRISNILNPKRKDCTREDYEIRMNAARDTANTMLAMLDEPTVIQPLKYDYNKVFKTPAPAGILNVVEVTADDEITRLLKEMLASFGIGEKPEIKNCMNCGSMKPSNILKDSICSNAGSVKLGHVVTDAMSDYSCWTPREEAAVNE